MLKKHALKIKYLFSSGVAFIIDYLLLLYFNSVLPVASLEIGAFIAWCVSSIINFFINRNFVFESDLPLIKALPEYYGLAGVVFVLKTYVLIELLTRAVKIPIDLAKPIAEVVFFIFNYIVQKMLIFKKKSEDGK